MVKNFRLYRVRGNALFGYQLITNKETPKRFIDSTTKNMPVSNTVISNRLIKKLRNENYLPRKELKTVYKTEKKLIKKISVD